MAIDPAILDHHLHQAVVDMGAATSAVLIHLGDRLGLYKAMAGAGPLTSTELADRTGTRERYVREWLNNQAAGGTVTYDAGAETYNLSEEAAFLFADETSPVFLPGFFECLMAFSADASTIEDAFRTGQGVGWEHHDHRLFSGTARFFAPGYRANLVTSWIPALDGVADKLVAGATVADVGCGYGITTLLMAQAYPDAVFVGYDPHDGSIAAARKAAAEAGLTDRVRFEVASAQDFPGTGYDLVAFFDCLHDMGDPVGALRHTADALADDGTVLLVEPAAGDSVSENLHPRGRLFYGVSTLVCTPASCSQDVGLGLGAQAGEARYQELFTEAGYSRLRRATETPFNLVLEGRK
ncbi:MAG: methyltransferase domain-containing protein [Actinomycetota bacterium]|nr:methyltransferase domain-containing protein [Actinomycetota bacterium]